MPKAKNKTKGAAIGGEQRKKRRKNSDSDSEGTSIKGAEINVPSLSDILGLLWDNQVQQKLYSIKAKYIGKRNIVIGQHDGVFFSNFLVFLLLQGHGVDNWVASNMTLHNFHGAELVDSYYVISIRHKQQN